MVDFTIVIPHRGNPLGLWSTITSCAEDLKHAVTRQKFDYNFVIVTNGEELPIEAKNAIWKTELSGRLLKHIHSDEPLTPPVARQRGADIADGKYIFFFDNHCMVARNYFERAVLDFEKYPEMDMVHSTTNFYAGEQLHYHYRLQLDYNFWARGTFMAYWQHKPYKIAAAGHGGFAIRKEVWDLVGGYGPESLFRGYGGEELIFDLKMWRYGRTNYLDPKIIHYHYAGNRGYDRHYSDEYYINLLVSALVIGGEKWLYKVFDSFLKDEHPRTGKSDWYTILQTAYERGKDYAAEVDSKSVRTLDELLPWFRENEIQY